jgi:acetylornithine deacetylase/succinyl-diaminopimelate desuccinylase-like protein
MLFVRSGADGISHSPLEWTEPEDVARAVDVLTAALSRLSE